MCTVFFFNDTATTEIYTLSLHDALPILYRLQVSSPTSLLKPYSSCGSQGCSSSIGRKRGVSGRFWKLKPRTAPEEAKTILRSEEHTSELQSQSNLVCRLLLEKKTKQRNRGRCCHCLTANRHSLRRIGQRDPDHPQSRHARPADPRSNKSPSNFFARNCKYTMH